MIEAEKRCRRYVSEPMPLLYPHCATAAIVRADTNLPTRAGRVVASRDRVDAARSAVRPVPAAQVSTSGTPTREHDILQLVPGSQSYVQIQWEANWEANRTGGGSSFTVLTSSPEVAQQYVPTLTDLGQR